MIKKILYWLIMKNPFYRHQKKSVNVINGITLIFTYRENDRQMVFMVKNQGKLKNSPGYFGFPWSRTTSSKDDVQQSSLPVRLSEELLDFDLDKAKQAGEVKSMEPYINIESPDFSSPLFDTTVYLIHLTGKPQFSPHREHFAQYYWKTPKEYIELYNTGKMLTLPSTIALLNFMDKNSPPDSGQISEFSYNNDSEIPWYQPLAGIYQLFPIAFALPGYVHRTNCFIIGDKGKPVILVDPSPKDGKEYSKIINTLNHIGLPYSEIFLTHHHGDHHHQAPRLAKELSLSITMSEYTYQKLLKRSGEKYFSDIKIKIAAEGDSLTNWLGNPVKVFEIPGHDEGQLALAPENLEWFIVGDLIQSQGTVVIGADEGNMAKYFKSLERVIKLNPSVLFPSHGFPMGTTYQLSETLKHRKIREQQILHYYQKEYSPEQMVKVIYKGIDKRLRSLALENIKSHLLKLKEENLI